MRPRRPPPTLRVVPDTTHKLPEDHVLPLPGHSGRGLRPGQRPSAPPGLPTVPGFRIVRELGRGGMGVVLEAWSEHLGRPVALKLLLPGAALDVELVLRLRREIAATARLQHPHLVAVLDAGEVGGAPWVALELVEGEPLSTRLAREGALPEREVARVGRALADALACAHDHGVLHRDLKPGNVLLDRQGRPRLSDFGLARLLDGEGRLTATGVALGTPAYMAPEQAEGGRVDARTDVYGLGALLYELLTGARPFTGPDPLVVLQGVLRRPPVRPRELRPEVDRELEALVLACLEKVPDRRPPDARTVRDRLDAWLVTPRRRAGSEPLLAAGAVLLVAVLGLGWLVVPAGSQGAPRPSLPPPSSLPAPPALPAWAGPLGTSASEAELCLASRRGEAERLDRALLNPDQRAALELGDHLRRLYRGESSLRELTFSQPSRPWDELARVCQLEPSLAGREGFTAVLALREKFPRLALLRLILAHFHEVRGDSVAAGEELDRAVREGPNDPLIFAARGQHRATHGDLEGALADFRAAISAGEGAFAGRNARRAGEVLMAMARLPEALGAFSEAIERAPADGLAWALRGRMRTLMGQLPAARQDLADARARGAAEADLWLLEGAILLGEGRPLEALPLLARAAEEDPLSLDPLEYRAQALIKLGGWEEALEAASATLARDPGSGISLLVGARALFGLSRYDEALRLAERARGRVPPPLEAGRAALEQAARGQPARARRSTWELVLASLEGRSRAGAAAALEQALAEAGQDPRLRLLRGALRREAGRPDSDEDLLAAAPLQGWDLVEAALALRTLGFADAGREVLARRAASDDDPELQSALVMHLAMDGDRAAVDREVIALEARLPEGHRCLSAALWYRAQMATAAGDHGQALRDARRVLELGRRGAPIPVELSELEQLVQAMQPGPR